MSPNVFVNFINSLVLIIVRNKIAKDAGESYPMGIPISCLNTLFQSLKKQLPNREFILYLRIIFASVTEDSL